MPKSLSVDKDFFMQVLYINTTSEPKHTYKAPLIACVIASLIISLQIPVVTNASVAYLVSSPITAPIVTPVTSPVTSPTGTPTVTVTPTPTSTIPSSGNNNGNNSGQNNTSNNSSSQSCTETAPLAPKLFQIKTTHTTAVLTFTPVTTATSYTIDYGLKANQKNFSVTFSADTKNGAVSYTINHLSPNKTYYFSVKANKNCVSGKESNTLKATTTVSRFSRARITTAWEQMRQIVLSWIH